MIGVLFVIGISFWAGSNLSSNREAEFENTATIDININETVPSATEIIKKMTTTVTKTMTPTASSIPQPTLTASPTVTPIFPPIESFVGTWVNSDSSTRGWTKIKITSEGSTLSAHFWGSCSPTDCDAGITSTVYTGNPVLLTIDHGFAVRDFTFSLSNDTLHVTTFNHYTDSSGREDKTDEDEFHK